MARAVDQRTGAIIGSGAGSTYNPLQGKGQSNANMPLPKANRLAVRSDQLGTLPKTPEHIAASSIQESLVYPSDRPKYFMHFGIFDYSRAGLLEVGTLQPWTGGSNQIMLPLSETLVDQLEAKWEEAEIGWMVGGIAESLKGISSADEAISRIGDMSKRFTADALKALSQGDALEAAKALGREAWPIAQAGLIQGGSPAGRTIGSLYGVAPNRFVTILYIGPEYKVYNFTWNLSPRNKQESETLRRIINVFKKAISPTIKHTVLWGYPCIFRIMFRPNNEQLFKFRPCVCRRFTANWAPMGRAAFYNTIGSSASGTYEEGNPPEGVTMQASFVEIEYWTQERMNEQPIRATDLQRSADW